MSVLKSTDGEYTTTPDGDDPTIAQIIAYELGNRS